MDGVAVGSDKCNERSDIELLGTIFFFQKFD